LSGIVCMACAGTIMKQVICAAQGQMSQVGCEFLTVSAGLAPVTLIRGVPLAMYR